MVERRRGVQPDEDQEHVGGECMKIVELSRQRAVYADDVWQMKEKIEIHLLAASTGLQES